MEIKNGMVYRDGRHVGNIDEGVFSSNSDARKFNPAELRHLAALMECEIHNTRQYESPENCPNYMRF